MCARPGPRYTSSSVSRYHEGDDGVGGVTVVVLAAAIVDGGGAGIGVARGDLHVSQRDPSVQRGDDERGEVIDRMFRRLLEREVDDKAPLPEFTRTITDKEMREVADCNLPFERHPTAAVAYGLIPGRGESSSASGRSSGSVCRVSEASRRYRDLTPGLWRYRTAEGCGSVADSSRRSRADRQISATPRWDLCLWAEFDIR